MEEGLGFGVWDWGGGRLSGLFDGLDLHTVWVCKVRSSRTRNGGTF